MMELVCLLSIMTWPDWIDSGERLSCARTAGSLIITYRNLDPYRYQKIVIFLNLDLKAQQSADPFGLYIKTTDWVLLIRDIPLTKSFQVLLFSFISLEADSFINYFFQRKLWRVKGMNLLMYLALMSMNWSGERLELYFLNSQQSSFVYTLYSLTRCLLGIFQIYFMIISDNAGWQLLGSIRTTTISPSPKLSLKFGM